MRIWQWRCPIFTAKIRQSFAFSALWHTCKVLCLCIWRMPTCSCYDKPEPLKALSILMRIAYTGKLTWWHGSGWSHRNDHAHNIAWIPIYNHHVEHIPTLQGQEHSWLERVAHIATRVHHTKCMITHTCRHIYIYIYIDTCIYLAQRCHIERESKVDIAIPRESSPSKVQER